MCAGPLPPITMEFLSPNWRPYYEIRSNTEADVGVRGEGRPLGFIPTGWFPTSVRMTPDGRTLLVVSGRGLSPRPSGGKGEPWLRITDLYRGSQIGRASCRE